MFDKSIKILVVDDMLTMRKLVGKALKDLGFSNITEASDGAKAWETLNQPDAKFDLILSDWNMPNSTGLDLLKRLRRDSRLKDTPFLLITAESEASQVAEAIQAGVDNYVTKPFNPQTIEQKLEAVFKKRFAA